MVTFLGETDDLSAAFPASGPAATARRTSFSPITFAKPCQLFRHHHQHSADRQPANFFTCDAEHRLSTRASDGFLTNPNRPGAVSVATTSACALRCSRYCPSDRCAISSEHICCSARLFITTGNAGQNVCTFQTGGGSPLSIVATNLRFQQADVWNQIPRRQEDFVLSSCLNSEFLPAPAPYSRVAARHRICAVVRTMADFSAAALLVQTPARNAATSERHQRAIMMISRIN